MSDTNQLTIDAYNKSLDEYIKGTPHKVEGDIQTWLDKSVSLLKTKAKILEIGVGHGKDADYLESKGFVVERTDASQSFIDYQRKNGHNARLLNVLSDNIDGQYDMVLADAVWLHFKPEEAKLACRKVRDALVEDGLFTFSLKEGEGEELTDRKLNNTRYFCYWQENDIRHMLEDVGFHDLDIFRAPDYRRDRPGWLLIIAKKSVE